MISHFLRIEVSQIMNEGFHPIEVDFKLKAPLRNEIFSFPVNKT